MSNGLRNNVVGLVARAVLAPSSHNTQPWRFVTSDAAIDMFADRTRGLPVNDPDDRELTISCGCALLNLRVAAAAHGLPVSVTLVPDAMQSDWLAHVAANPRATAAPSDAVLADCIESRRTYRKRFARTLISNAEIEQLVTAASMEGATFRPIVSERERRLLAMLVAEGDAVLWSNPAWRRELAAWLHPRRQGDGLTTTAAPLSRFIVSTFDMGERAGEKDSDLAATAPLLAVLTTDHDDPRDWLLAGQALQRVLLTACRLGLQASFLNQPIQVPALRARLQQLEIAGGDWPQVLLRIGHAPAELRATPRRDIEDVLQPHPILNAMLAVD